MLLKSTGSNVRDNLLFPFPARMLFISQFENPASVYIYGFVKTHAMQVILSIFIYKTHRTAQDT